MDSIIDPRFEGELTNSIDVELPTTPKHTFALRDLVATAPYVILGRRTVKQRGKELKLLIKFTEAKGNSFQVHIKTNVQHAHWKPKPEAWYYFEPGYITLGVKPNIDWHAYEHTLRTIAATMRHLGQQIKAGELTYHEAKKASQKLLKTNDPWQYVNTLPVEKNTLVDLSGGGLHHSWEEDPRHAPFGNVLLELQAEALDNISTFRGFDKGKIGTDGVVRPVHIDEYFAFIDRAPAVNNPTTHIHHPVLATQTTDYTYEHLISTPFYNLDKLTLRQKDGYYQTTIDGYRHIFLKSGRVTVTANQHPITLTAAHSCFIPAHAKTFTVTASADNCELLLSY